MLSLYISLPKEQQNSRRSAATFEPLAAVEKLPGLGFTMVLDGRAPGETPRLVLLILTEYGNDRKQ